MTTTTQTIMFIALVCVAVGFRVYRQSREQRWTITTIWVMPAIFLAITVLIVAGDTLAQPIALPAGIAGLAAGFALGTYQGNHTVLRFDKAAKAVFIRITPIGTLIFVGVLLLRILIRLPGMNAAIQQAQTSGTVQPPSPLEALLGSGLLALAAGSIAGLRWYVHRAYNAA